MLKKRHRPNQEELSYFIRAEARFKCERCGAPEGSEPGRTLTVNLVNKAFANTWTANLVALCRHCQGRLRVIPLDHLVNQLEMFGDFELKWLGPHLERLGIRVPDTRSRNN
jgi:hypothetical protein